MKTKGKQMETTKRIEYIDFIKGICIFISVFLIVLCIGIIKLIEKNRFSSGLLLGKTKVIVALAILCVLGTSCIKKMNLYQDDKDGNGNITVGKRQDMIGDTDFFYPFGEESHDNTAEITIRTQAPITNVSANIPKLKYNKSWILLLTQDDCKQAAFSNTWAAINGKPLSIAYFYQLAHLQYGDLPPDCYSIEKTLGSTDGAKNEVRFSFSTTLSPEWEWMNSQTQIYKGYTKEYYRFFMKDGLTWGDVKEMLNYGVGIAMHDVDLPEEEETVDKIIQHFDIAQEIIKNKLAGRICKMITKPSGKSEYITAAKNSPTILTMAAEDGQKVYPEKITDDLEKVVFNRGFYSISSLKQEIEKQLELSDKERAAIYVGVHGTDSYWADFLLWLNDTYGKNGADNVWMPNQEEFYEYNYYRIHGTTEAIKVDDHTLKLKVVLPGKDSFYYPSVTVNLSGLTTANIQSIETNSAISGLSYTNYNDGIMLNIDCRKYLTEHAENFVKRYENNSSSLSNKADALYFVNMLKDSDKKKSLLNRIK